MHVTLKRLERFAKNPHVELLVGLTLLATGLMEAGDTLFEDLAGGDIGAHHGVIVLGLAHALKALPGTLAGLMLVADAEDRDRD